VGLSLVVGDARLHEFLRYRVHFLVDMIVQKLKSIIHANFF